MSMIFIMRGTSCSGKDTFIKEYFGMQNPNVLSSDDFRQMMFGNIAEQRYNKQVFDMMYSILEMRLQHRAEWTILNSTNLRISDIRTPIELCKKYHTPFTILSVNPPPLIVLKRRNKHRKSEFGLDVPDEVLEKHYNRYFSSMDPFIEEAKNNPYCSFIEFDQSHTVLNHVY